MIRRSAFGLLLLVALLLGWFALPIRSQTLIISGEASGGAGAVNNVNVFHQSTVRHVSSTSHMIGALRLMSGTPNNQLAIVTHFGALAVTCYTSAGATESCGGTGGTGGSGDAVNVFHQSTIRHVSSLTHVVIVDWQLWAHVASAQSGAWAVTAHAGTGAFQVTQSGTWTVQAAHLAGTPSVSQGSVWPVLSHAFQSGTWTIQAAHQGGTPWTVSHISSVVHAVLIQSAHVNIAPGATWPVTQSGTWTVQPGNTPNTTAWLGNTQHISSVVHAVLVQAVHVNVAPGTTFTVTANQGGSWTAAATQSGTWTVQPGNTANTTAWLVRDTAGQSGAFTIQAAHQTVVSHVSSVVHAVLIQSAHVNIAPGTTWFTQVGHISSAIHVGGFIGIRDGLNPTGWARVNHAGQLITNCEAGCGAGSSDAVNVFHQSTVRHVSSVTHIAGGVMVRDPLCATCSAQVSHANALRVEGQGGGGALTVQAGQSGVWNVTAHAGYANQWNVAHITSLLHVGGFIGIRDGLNPTGWARVNHAGQLITNCETGCGAGSSDAVNVFHQSTVRHVSSVTHVGGGIMIRDPLCLTCNALVDHTGALRTTTTVDNVNVFHQSTIRHVSSVMHVVSGTTGKNLQTASFSLTATGTVVAGVSGLRIRVYAVKLIASAAISVNWRDGGATNLEGAQPLAANGGYTEGTNPPAFLFQTSAGNSLDLVISGAGTAAGRVSYFAE